MGKLTLRNHCETALSVSLETLILPGVAGTHNVKDDLRQELSLIADGIASIDNRTRDLLGLGLAVDDGVAVLNLATMTSVGLNEDVNKVAEGLLVNATIQDDEAPRLQRLRVWQQELLTTKVPAALGAGIELLASELDFGVGKKTSSGLEN